MDSFFCDMEIFSKNNKGPVIIYISNKAADDKELIKERLSDFDYVLCKLNVDNWDEQLTPWEAANCMNGRCFTGNGNILLKELEEDIIPKLKNRYPTSKIYLAGYSLAGLFSLWSLYECEMLDGAVCCSGSLWYPGWKDYAYEHSLDREVKVYLSLGKKEEKTKNPIMQSVGDVTRLQHKLLLENKNVNVSEMVWHDGGHFSNVTDRVTQGLKWILMEK